MQNLAVPLTVGASVLVVSFLIMTCLPRWRRIYAIGLVGSVLHLIGVIRWQVFHSNFLLLDLAGVALMCIAGFWTLGRAIIQMKGRQA